MKTILELQQETAEKFDEAVLRGELFEEYLDYDHLPYQAMKQDAVKSFLSSSQQSAYDLGCKVTMERVREEVENLNKYYGNPKGGLMVYDKDLLDVLSILSPTPESDLSTKE